MTGSLRLIRAPINGVSWTVAEQDRERLLAWIQSGWEGELHRVAPGRRVVRVDGTADPVVLKQFRAEGIVAALKRLWRGSPAASEWGTLRRVRDLGLPVPRPVACGEGRGLFRRESFLVTEVLQDASPLRRVLFGEEPASGRQRWAVIREAARLLRRMHDAGVSQADLHLGNILARVQSTPPELFLIDLHRARVSGRVGNAMRWRDLATLHGGCPEATRTDQLRFLQAYLAGPPVLPVDLEGLVGRLERWGLRHRFRLWARRARRGVGENRDFLPISVGEYKGFARRSSWSAPLRHLCERPEALLTGPEVRLLKDSRTTTVGVLPVDGGAVFVKRYNEQGLGYGMKNVMRTSRARRAWMAANGLQMRRIPTPMPHLYLEQRRLRVLGDSYLITEAVDGVGLLQWSLGWWQAKGSLRKKRLLARESGILLRALHERGVSHRDLKGDNILVREAGPGRFRLTLVDLDGVQFGRTGWQRRARDLARLSWDFRDHPAVTRGDRLRLLLAYLVPKDRPAWKKLWRAVATAEEHAGWALYTLPPWQRQGEAGS